MNRTKFINDLKKELKNNNVSEIEEILEDYEQHFNFKIEEGKTEEEIIRKLSKPSEIAKEYASNSKKTNNGQKGLIIAGLSFFNLFAFCFYVLMFATVLVVGALSIASLATGVCLITTLNIANLIPSMPYLCAFALGISFLGLSALSAIGTIYMYLYVKQWLKIYFRWCKNLLNNNIYPTLSAHPKISKKLSSNFKLICMIGLITFVSAFCIGYLAMILYTGNFEPWHIWNWFLQ